MEQYFFDRSSGWHHRRYYRKWIHYHRNKNVRNGSRKLWRVLWGLQRCRLRVFGNWFSALKKILETSSNKQDRFCFQQMILELTSGKFVALEIGADNSSANVYKEFRKLCGPSDPVGFDVCISWNSQILFIFFFILQVVARQLYPKSIRAKYGVSKVQNAIHCTDLEEDCKLEVEYFFKILASWWCIHKFAPK